jgi:hypothetical protein
MAVRGDRFKAQRIRVREITESIEMMEARKKLESPSVIALLDKNIDHCRKQLNSILMDMIKDGYRGEGL